MRLWRKFYCLASSFYFSEPPPGGFSHFIVEYRAKMFNQVLEQDYFELLGMPQQFDIDDNKLQEQLRELQKQFHPDNYAGQEPELTQQALLASSQVNQAYTTLKDPLNRAIYLLQLYGVIVDLVHDTKFSPQFLMAQIELREEIAEAEQDSNIEKLEEIERKIQFTSKDLIAEIKINFASADYQRVVELVKMLAFYTKLEQMLNNIIGQL